MVGGQHHHIVEPAAIEPGEELPERVVERVELQAHLEPLGAVAMADIVGCREADRQHVRRTVAAELALVDEAARKGEGLSVESGPIGVITCAGAVGQPTGTDGAAARQFRRAVAGRAAHRDRERRNTGRDLGGDVPIDGNLGRSSKAVREDRSRNGRRDNTSGVGVVPAHHHRRAVLPGYRDRCGCAGAALRRSPSVGTRRWTAETL